MMPSDDAGAAVGQQLLREIREGMAVYEVDGRRLGAVRTVFLGSPAGAGAAPATSADVAPRGHSFIDDLAAALAPDELPPEVQERLRLGGFIRIDTAGIFRADRYALPEQVASVDDERVTLGVSREDLLVARSPREAEC